MFTRMIILGGFGIFLCNLLILNAYILFVLPKQIQLHTRDTTAITTQPSVTPAPSECDESCIRTFQDRIGKLEDQLLLSVPSTSPVKAPTTQQKVTQEIFIPLGSGYTTNDQWEDIPGSDVYIDTAKYPKIQTVYFETSLRIPTKNGEVFARLYNVTDKHPVWFSDTSTTSETSVFQGKRITLDTGNKQYRIQMKTTLRYQSILDSGRIKILTQ